MIIRKILPVIAIGCLASCIKSVKETEAPTAIISAGNITESVNQFRNLLGNINTSPGNTTGRREINWDGVPDNFSQQSLPADFFNPVGTNANASLQRGLAYESAGDFRVSANAFAEVNSLAPSDLTSFSGTKVFANVSSTAWQISFRVPAENTAATVNAFGVVFTGVDLANTSYIELFNGSQSLGRYYALPHNNLGNHSFVGVHFQQTGFTSVKVVHGSASLNTGEKDISRGGTKDLVALDDFIYAEPVKKQ